MTKEEIGEKLKAKRISCGMTQQEVAEKIGRKQPIVGHWETGYSQPDANTLFMLCDIFDTTVDEVFGLSPKDNFTKSEHDHIKKYRALDDSGKKHIDYELGRELDRMEQLKQASSPAAIIEFQPKASTDNLMVEYFRSASAGSGVFILGNEVTEQIAIPNTPENRNVDFAIKVSGDSMFPDYEDGDIVLVSQKSELHHGDVGIFIINSNAYIKEYGEEELISRNPEADNISIAEYDNIVCMGKVVGKL